MKKLKLMNDVLTIPNILSVFRICLIPLIVWFYNNDYNFYAVCVLVLSGLTDIVDGFIARHFNMISDVGKILDPVADKLTQAVTLFCLMAKFPYMILIFVILFVKEISLSIVGIFVIRKTKTVKGANWHGKVTTFLLYFTMIVHILWYNINLVVSNLLISVCIAFMMLSFIMYLIRHFEQLKEEN